MNLRKGMIWSTVCLGGAFLTLPVIAETAAPPDGDWPAYNRSIEGDRFTPLREIDTHNVKNLKLGCHFDFGRRTGLQTGPVVVDGTMYVTSEFDTIALDAANCAVKWSVQDNYVPVDHTARGVAVQDGRLFRTTEDARVLAYDAASGVKLWERRIGDAAYKEVAPAVPLAWNGLVFAAVAGGDNYAVQGRIYALDAVTGREVWGHATVPSPLLDLPPGGPDAVATWHVPQGLPITGGGVWSTFSLDPERQLLYVPIGNAAPDFKRDLRKGDDLYTDSLLVLDAATGAYRSHIVLTRNDFHDWDAGAAPALIVTRGGQRLVVSSPKDGWLRGINPDTGLPSWTAQVTTIENAETPLTGTGVHFCPGTQGGSEWNGPAYDPSRNQVYVGTVDWCETVKVTGNAVASMGQPGQPWTGEVSKKNAFGVFDPFADARGWVTAVDADSGAMRWQYRTAYPVVSGITPTAGDLVFYGDLAGHFGALGADNGALLWSDDLGAAVGGGIAVYTAAGHEHVAAAIGLTSPTWPLTPQVNAQIVVFDLP